MQSYYAEYTTDNYIEILLHSNYYTILLHSITSVLKAVIQLNEEFSGIPVLLK